MIWKILLVVLIIFLAGTGYCVHLAIQKIKRMNRYVEVKKGMTEQEALDILGTDYDDKMVKPYYVKYTWRIDNPKYKGIRLVEIEIDHNEVFNVVGKK